MAKDRRGELGRLGEEVAALYLRLHGWSIVARRLRIAGVEVDLVARREHVDALVEVKWRGPTLGSNLPLAAFVSPPQQRRLVRAALAWAARDGDGRRCTFRIDLVILRPSGPPPFISHVSDLTGGVAREMAAGRPRDGS